MRHSQPRARQRQRPVPGQGSLGKEGLGGRLHRLAGWAHTRRCCQEICRDQTDSITHPAYRPACRGMLGTCQQQARQKGCRQLPPCPARTSECVCVVVVVGRDSDTPEPACCLRRIPGPRLHDFIYAPGQAKVRGQQLQRARDGQAGALDRQLMREPGALGRGLARGQLSHRPAIDNACGIKKTHVSITSRILVVRKPRKPAQK